MYSVMKLDGRFAVINRERSVSCSIVKSVHSYWPTLMQAREIARDLNSYVKSKNNRK